MDYYSGKKFFLSIMLLLFATIAKAQRTVPTNDDTRSVNRRFADSLYAVHSGKTVNAKGAENKKIDTAAVMASKNDVARHFISSNKEIPSATFYQNTWYNERVKVPNFSFQQIPDEIVLRLINPSKEQHFCFPIKKRKSSSYGWRWGRPHSGIDIALNTGDKIYAAFDGVVRLAKYNGGYGNCVVIRHYNNLETLYGHLSKIKVKVGEKVKAGDVIGLGGNTGRSTGPHLHFECRLLYACFDPEWIFDLETYNIKTSFIRIDKSYFGVESSEKKANKKVAKSRLSKVDKCFEGKPYVKTSSLIAEERKLIKAGKMQQYSTTAVTTQSANSQNRYIVAKKGDKMTEIAKRYNITPRQLKDLNPSISTNVLKKETKIRIK
jgi:murein DD-endopeptidase MepM/ murein hydrolase activator NlpD